MKRDLSALLALALLTTASGAAAQTAPKWDILDWNPKTMADDVLLPLPCGGTMVFRPIGTSRASGTNKRTYLDDREVLLGGLDEEIPASGALRTDFVAGPFEDKAGARFYLLGKYEVTNQQYDAVMGAPACGE
ncbi:MAG: hypothetical protein NTV97_13090, partial [Alphaproteobacteria bacterium]|nr:hypothetical protein [Alphaproteobacteria bacterium]